VIFPRCFSIGTPAGIRLLCGFIPRGGVSLPASATFSALLRKADRKSCQGALVSEELVWVNQARQGNDEAFTRLVEQYQTPVYNLCYRMLGEAEAAEDAAQETFLRAYQHLRRYDQERPFATWLLSIAAHYCIDRLRRRKLWAFSIEEHEDEEDSGHEIADANSLDPEDESLRREERARVQQLLQTLEATDRAAIVMRYWYDFSEAEIADALHLTVSAVKSRLHRARRALARQLQAEAESAAVRSPGRPYESPAF
jgi:RNA polymerase sigma-70 factor (ECF subfamily)